MFSSARKPPASIHPAPTAFTVTPLLAHSRASARVRFNTPAWAAQYALPFAIPRSASTELRFTTRPLSRLSISRPAARQARKTPVRFASITRRHSASEISSAGLAKCRSRALARMSSRPSSEIARSTRESTSRSSAASIACAKPLRSSAQISFAHEFAATSSRCDRVVVATPTSAPASASDTAAARPNGFAAPITTATFPANENCSSVTRVPLRPATSLLAARPEALIGRAEPPHPASRARQFHHRCKPRRQLSPGQPTTVQHDHLSVHVARQVGGEEDAERPKLLVPPEPAHRYEHAVLPPLFDRRVAVREQPRRDQVRLNRRGVRHRQRACEVDQPRLRRGVDEVVPPGAQPEARSNVDDLA